MPQKLKEFDLLSVLLKKPSCFSLTKSTPSFSNLCEGWPKAKAATSLLLNLILPEDRTACKQRIRELLTSRGKKGPFSIYLRDPNRFLDWRGNDKIMLYYVCVQTICVERQSLPPFYCGSISWEFFGCTKCLLRVVTLLAFYPCVTRTKDWQLSFSFLLLTSMPHICVSDIYILLCYIIHTGTKVKCQSKYSETLILSRPARDKKEAMKEKDGT